jgi:hypothetical protein
MILQLLGALQYKVGHAVKSSHRPKQLIKLHATLLYLTEGPLRL